MNLVVGAVFGAVLMGVFVPRWQLKHTLCLAGWMCLVLVVFYFKNR